MSNAAVLDARTIHEQLAAQNLRLASPTEAGWYVFVTAEGGTVKRVWATDLPGCDVERVTSCLDWRVPVVCGADIEGPAAREQHRLDALWARSEEAAGGDPWAQSGGVPTGRGGYGVGL